MISMLAALAKFGAKEARGEETFAFAGEPKIALKFVAVLATPKIEFSAIGDRTGPTIPCGTDTVVATVCVADSPGCGAVSVDAVALFAVGAEFRSLRMPLLGAGLFGAGGGK
jgi:hypothetical protein